MAKCFSKYRLAKELSTFAANSGSFDLYETLMRFVSLMGCTVRAFSNLRTARDTLWSPISPSFFHKDVQKELLEGSWRLHATTTFVSKSLDLINSASDCSSSSLTSVCHRTGDSRSGETTDSARSCRTKIFICASYFLGKKIAMTTAT